MDRLVRRYAFMPFSAPILPTPFPSTSLGMAANHTTDLVPPPARESAFHSAAFLPSSHFITLRRLLASAPQTVQSSFSHRDPLFSESQLRRQTADRSISPRYYCSDTRGNPYSHLSHSGSHTRCTIAHAPCTVRSLHDFRSGTPTTVPFLFHVILSN
jgi:hypothetical protein